MSSVYYTKYALALFVVLGISSAFRFPQHNPKRSIFLQMTSTEKMKNDWTSSLTRSAALSAVIAFNFVIGTGIPANALEGSDNPQSIQSVGTSVVKKTVDYKSFKLPYEHVNLPFGEFIGKATLVVNMKLDDPQTPTQFPILLEMYNKYAKDGLNVVIFPTEQGYFEPDDDETCRAKAKEYYGFGSYPNAVVFDKVDLIGPSAHPLFTALTNDLPTPNVYNRITLNYEKFLLNANGEPIRRYPRKFSANDFEADIVAILKGEPLPAETAEYEKAWREAKREAMKSEYAFRLNYNYYNSPDSMYKYNSERDR